MNESNLNPLLTLVNPDTLANATLEELLELLGFKNEWQTVSISFVLPCFNLIGVLLCSLTTYIFFQRDFVNPVFYYYRLLCLVYIVHLLHNIPYGPLYSLHYFPRVNTYASSMYSIYYTILSNFLYHFEDLIQMAILLDRMKMFSSFLVRHFAYTPRLVSLLVCLACFLTEFPLVFSFKVVASTYYYHDADMSQHKGTFYHTISSEFSSTLHGQILMGFTQLFLNQFLTLVVGVALNVVSVNQYKSYLRQRRTAMEELELMSIHTKYKTQREMRELSERERINRKIEKNMFYMAFALCAISILIRVLLIVSYVYFFFFSTYCC